VKDIDLSNHDENPPAKFPLTGGFPFLGSNLFRLKELNNTRVGSLTLYF